MYSKVRKPNREPRIEPHQPETTMETHEPPTEPNRNLNDLYMKPEPGEPVCQNRSSNQ